MTASILIIDQELKTFTCFDKYLIMLVTVCKIEQVWRQQTVHPVKQLK